MVFRHRAKVIGLIVAVSLLPQSPGRTRPEFAAEVVWQNGKRETVGSWARLDSDACFAYEERERAEHLSRRVSLGRFRPLGPPPPI